MAKKCAIKSKKEKKCFPSTKFRADLSPGNGLIIILCRKLFQPEKLA